ncbi:TPA: tetratricopeptide repeat protein, partial [Candidatus Bipolaricaulota bacterium]|nr:tetratricopeptide repeat protein [Candidatus Bipolaricaulota bacterium]
MEKLTGKPITPASLEGADILVILEPWGWYHPGEVEAIRGFVRAGGGLLLAAGPWRGSGLRAANGIASYLGASFRANGRVRDPTDHYSDRSHIIIVSTLADHPIARGVGSFYFQGTYIARLGPAAVVAESDPDAWFDHFGAEDWGDGERQPEEESGPFPLIAAMGFGAGRVVLAGDGSFTYNSWIDKLDAERLALNVMEWLASGRREAADQPPVAFFTCSPTERGTLRCDASPSLDPDGEIVLYEWDWDGDGVYETSTGRPLVEHSPLEGWAAISLRVTDAAGNASSLTLSRGDLASYWVLRGSLNLEACRLQEAVGDLAQAVDLAPEDPEAHYWLGRAYGALGRHDEAIGELEKARELGFYRESVTLALSASYSYRGDYGVAIGLLRDLLAAMPESTYAKVALGWKLLLNREFEAAREILEEVQGVHIVARNNLGVLSYFEGKWQEAVDKLRPISESASDPLLALEANAFPGLAYSRLGEEDLARAAFER